MSRFIATVVLLIVPTLALAEDRLPAPDYQRQPSDPEWLAQVVQLHGHLGPSVVAGARLGMIGLRAVGAKGYFDVEVTCEGPMAKPPQACFLDGIQAATGATMGKRTLNWVQADQIAVRIRNTHTGQAAELRPTPALMDLLASFKSQPQAGAEHGPGQQDHERLEAIARKIAAMPEKEVASVTLTKDGEATRTAQAGSVWMDVYQGEPVPYENVLEDLATARMIYLGERHTLQRHHDMQAKILADLAQKGLPLALGLEQMESSQQPHLDRYNRGEINFEQLAEATGWPKRWQNYQQYRPIMEAARDRKAPIVALNATSETIRQVVRSGGVEHLTAELRKQLPAEMLLQDPPYEQLLSLQMMVHVAATPQTLRPMIEAQIARDEAMAQAICTFLKSEQGRGRKVLVLCGVGHVSHGLGLPTRVRRRVPDITDRIVLSSESGEVRLSAAEQAQARDIEITHAQLREVKQPVADYLCVKPLAEQPVVAFPGGT